MSSNHKATLRLGNIAIDVVLKKIKNLHLRVHPPSGKVSISAPLRTNFSSIRLFAISKLKWIRKHQRRMVQKDIAPTREYTSRESHCFKGRRYLLNVVEENVAPYVLLKPGTLELHVRPGANREKRKTVLEKWYRDQMKEIIPELIEKWEGRMGVKVNEFGIKRMRTRWGTCSLPAKRIWLNLELAKKPEECLEYVVVHEMTHLLERKHNDRFISLLTGFLPKWKYCKDELNRLPIGHEDVHY